jgi:hypothetical protein
MTNQTKSSEKVVFFIDKEKFNSETSLLTPRAILTEYAKENPAETTLIRKAGSGTEKLTELDTPIEVKDGTRFTVLHNGPTTVS